MEAKNEMPIYLYHSKNDYIIGIPVRFYINQCFLYFFSPAGMAIGKWLLAGGMGHE